VKKRWIANFVLFWRVVVIFITGSLAVGINLWERKKERKEARKRYEEIKKHL